MHAPASARQAFNDVDKTQLGMRLASSCFKLPAFFALCLTASCAPSAKRAGHSMTAHEAKREVIDANLQADRDGEPRTPPTETKPAPTATPELRPLYAEVPKGGRLIGETGPVALEDWGRGGHWVAHCSIPPETKVGPRGSPSRAPDLHLTLGETTESIDALLGSDDSGRFLVILAEEKAWLVDAATFQRLDLTKLDPDLRFDELPSHRSFAFTDDGLVLLSGSEGKFGYFLHLSGLEGLDEDVLSHAHPIDFGPRPVWRVEGHGDSFAGITVPEGSTHKTWPVSLSNAPTPRCQSPSAPFPSFERVSAYRPDPSLVAVWAATPPADEKVVKLEPVEAPGFVFGFRDGWVRREDSGRLLLVRGKTQEQIASERCGARILHADEKTGLFLIACEEYTPVLPKTPPKTRTKPKYRFELYLVRPGFVRSLKVDTMRTGIDHRGPANQHFVPIRPGATAALVDFEKRTVIPLDGDLQVVLSNPTGAILRRGSELRLWTTRGEENIDLRVGALDPILTTVHAAAVSDTMLLLDGSLRTWKLPAAPLAITEQGYALVPKKAPRMGSWPEGPLLLLAPPRDDSSPSASK